MTVMVHGAASHSIALHGDKPESTKLLGSGCRCHDKEISWQTIEDPREKHQQSLRGWNLLESSDVALGAWYHSLIQIMSSCDTRYNACNRALVSTLWEHLASKLAAGKCSNATSTLDEFWPAYIQNSDFWCFSSLSSVQEFINFLLDLFKLLKSFHGWVLRRIRTSQDSNIIMMNTGEPWIACLIHIQSKTF